MLLNTPEIRRIESRFLSLFERTFLKGIKGKPAPSYLKSVKTQFKSKTFQIQADKIIDDIYLQSIEHTDKQTKKAQASVLKKGSRHLSAASKPLPITEEAVRQAVGLSKEVTESIIKFLKDDGIYLEHPNTLEKRVRELWGGQKYRAVRFARTFTADVATNTELWRYQDAGIDDLQFYAKIDDKTSPQCRTMHGTVFKTDSPEARRYRCPLHQNCRSSLLPVPITQKVDPKMRFENRDFTRQMDQEFNILDDRTDKDLIKKTFSDIDTFNEKYRIDQFILDEDVEARLQKLNIQILSEIPKEKTNLKYTPVKTVKKAEEWLLENTSVKYADFKGVHIDIVNEMIESFVYHLNLEPKLANKMKFYGTGQAQFELWYQDELKKEIEWLKKLHPEDEKLILERAKRRIKKPKMDGKTYAHSWNHPKFGGIGVNKKFGSNPLTFSECAEKDESVGWHPTGCKTIKSIFDHEFGHELDNIYNISNSDIVSNLYTKKNIEEIHNNLSRYALTSKQELVAEAWAEYLNNPSPRNIAKEVGEFITSEVNKGKS